MPEDTFTSDATADKGTRASKPPLATPKPPSVLEQLKIELGKKIERPEIEIDVPERDGIAVRFSPNITQHQIRAWRRNAGENTKAGFDPTKFACQVIGHTCSGIYVNGEQVTTSDGLGLTFASQEILDMVEATRPIPDGIQAFYGLDPHLEATALAVMEHAGYSDEVDAVDPTTAY